MATYKIKRFTSIQIDDKKEEKIEKEIKKAYKKAAGHGAIGAVEGTVGYKLLKDGLKNKSKLATLGGAISLLAAGGHAKNAYKNTKAATQASKNPEHRIWRKYQKNNSDAMTPQQPQQESHALRNTLLGVGATAAAFMGAKRGLLGNTAMKYANQGYAKVGQMVGSKGMVRSGVNGQAKAMAMGTEGFANMGVRDQAKLVAQNRSSILKDNQELNNLYKKTADKTKFVANTPQANADLAAKKAQIQGQNAMNNTKPTKIMGSDPEDIQIAFSKIN